MNLIKKKYLYFFLVFNTFFPATLLSATVCLTFRLLSCSCECPYCFLFNSFTICLLIKKISESRKLLNQGSKSKDKDKPSDILADIELEFERRHAAKKV